jgi:hypothetical protein
MELDEDEEDDYESEEEDDGSDALFDPLQDLIRKPETVRKLGPGREEYLTKLVHLLAHERLQGPAC